MREIPQVGGIPGNAMGYRGIPWYVVQNSVPSRIPWDSMGMSVGCRGKSVGYNGIQIAFTDVGYE